MNVACPICGSSNFVDSMNHGSHYHHCVYCGLLWRSDETKLEDTTDFYTAEGGNPLEAVDAAKTTLHRRILRQASRRLGRKGRLLDIGSSRGDFMLAAKAEGWDVVGLEPVEELAQVSQGRGLTTYTGTLETFPKDVGQFDLITWWDVLILLPDPVAEMKRAAMLLTPDGQMYMRLRQHAVVRAIDTLWPITGGLLGWKNPSVYHPCNYEPRTVRTLLTRVGLRGEIKGSKMTRGDAYGIGGRSFGLISAGKSIANAILGAVEAASLGNLILSPSMDVWVRR